MNLLAGGCWGRGAAGIGFGAGGFLLGRETAEAEADGTGTVPFYGEHQAGIATAAQDRLHFAAFDLTEDASRGDLRELMREWSATPTESRSPHPTTRARPAASSLPALAEELSQVPAQIQAG
jgi:hypothetical protein